MRSGLTNVENDLQAQYNALPAATRPAPLADFAGLTSIRGWRTNSGTSFHASGSAVDVNYQNQPYIATRSVTAAGTVFGGEAGGATAATRALRRPAVEVYDRATDFVNTINFGAIATALNATVPFINITPAIVATMTQADVNERIAGEATRDVYQRFRATSDALASYLSLAFLTNYDAVLRPPYCKY
jgi:hypothetical protein